nr:RHS repeat-associated core domain-containing protein [Halomonas sp. ISL-56]
MPLVTPNGQPRWLAEPDDWAAVKNQRAVRNVTQPIRFQGQWHDEESGLYYNRHRYYNPQQGRYISQDPIGLRGGTNLYGYVTNPTGMVDPMGLKGVGQCGQGGLSLEGYMQERYGKLAITDDERLFAAAGDRQAFWDSRMERGDPIAPVAIGILNNETYVGYKFVGGRLANRFTGLKGEALNDLGVDLMRAHADAVDFDFNEQIGIPGLLSPEQAAAYHHEVFSDHGLGSWQFGGTLANTSPNLMRSIWCTGCDHEGEAIR